MLPRIRRTVLRSTVAVGAAAALAVSAAAPAAAAVEDPPWVVSPAHYWEKTNGDNCIHSSEAMDIPGVGTIFYRCGVGPQTTVTAWVKGKAYPMNYGGTWSYGWGTPNHWVDYECMAPGTPIFVEGTRRQVIPPSPENPKAVLYTDRVAVWNKSDRLFRHAALPARCGNPSVFTDIGTSHGFYKPIYWAATNGIVTGGKDGKIRHTQAVTREEMAVTLARWGNIGNFGKNNGGYETNIDPRRIDPTIRPKFRDVPAARKYSVEISVLSQVGVIKGWPDGTFRPTQNVTRGQTAAFLYRLAGSPTYTPPKTSRFKDLTTRTPFYKEISWMAQKGFTTGYSDKTYRPNATINRGEMLVMLHRFDKVYAWPHLEPRIVK